MQKKLFRRHSANKIKNRRTGDDVKNRFSAIDKKTRRKYGASEMSFPTTFGGLKYNRRYDRWAAVVVEVSNIILSRSERRVQPLFVPSRTQCKTFGAHLSLKTRLNRFFCRLRLPDRINLSSHPCKSRAEVSSYA